jgi:predicted metal-dependent phosphoesterase TrpH
VPPNAEDGFGRADLHLHTRASDGMQTTRDLLDAVEHHTDLDVIAITDHDETSASLEARDWAWRRGYRVQVVPGVEVTTRDGHLLALFIEERPPALRRLRATVEWVIQRGGVCVAPHPCTRLTHSLSLAVLRPVLADRLLAGIEVLNASLAGRASRAHALRLADEYALAAIGSSDAHMRAMIGLARTRFAGRTPQDLRRAIDTAATRAEGRFATAGEIAGEALPQLTRSMLVLPMRRVARLLRDRRRQHAKS